MSIKHPWDRDVLKEIDFSFSTLSNDLNFIFSSAKKLIFGNSDKKFQEIFAVSNDQILRTSFLDYLPR